MALEGLGEDQIAEREHTLLAHVPPELPIGNVTLRAILAEAGWVDDTYWAVRNRLIERGLLETGRGKGGSVRRTLSDQPNLQLANENGAALVLAPILPERALYEPMAEVIRGKWAQDYRLDAHVVEITAQQGARQTGGRWTRPDITVASLRTFAYVPGRHFDLITFEVKAIDGLDVTVVYEALAHRRAATKAYALVHIPEGRRDLAASILDDISSEAKKMGVGLIVAADPANYDTWEELVEAVRCKPDPERLNDFLAQQVSTAFREQIVRWFR